MWIFSQVWFACLVGFAFGVGLTWLWQVRPLGRRVADLQRSADLADAAQRRGGQRADADEFRLGFANTSYDAGPASDLGRSVDRTMLDEPLTAATQVEPPTHVETRQIGSVDDYVEALVQEYRGDTSTDSPAWTEQTPEAVESWRPGALGAQLGSPEHDRTDYDRTNYDYADQTTYPDERTESPEQQQERAEVTQVNAFPAQPYEQEPAHQTGYAADQDFGGDADEQYLDYLRSGADEEPAETEEDRAAANRGALAISAEHSAEPEDEAVDELFGTTGQYADEDYRRQETHDPAEMTTVLPSIADEEPTPEPAEGAAHHSVIGDPESLDGAASQDYYEAGEPITNVRPPASGGGPIATAQPFQLDGPDRADLGHRQGQLTPIEEGGFQPFAKAGEQLFDGEYEAEPVGYSDEAVQWQDGWTDVVDNGPVNGTHLPDAQGPEPAEEPAERTGPVSADVIRDAEPAAADDVDQEDDESVHAEPESAVESTTVFSPITEHSTNGSEPHEAYSETEREHQGQTDYHDVSALAEQPAEDYYDQDYADDEPAEESARSLFEPVIPPEQPTNYLSPVAPPGPQQHQPQDRPAPTAPHPIRVRTGVAQPYRPTEPDRSVEAGQANAGTQQVPLPNRPVRAPAGSAGWQTGPFGPGSALPLPDGSAPSPRFRVKARTSSMVFHTESSPFYERLEPQVWFVSQEDAQRAGFTSWERPRSW